MIEAEEFGVDFDLVFEPPKGAKMNMKAKKPIKRTISNEQIVQAIINIENAMSQFTALINGIDDAFREYLHWSKDADKFGKHMEKRNKELLEKYEKEKKEKENGKSAKTKSKRSGTSTKVSTK